MPWKDSDAQKHTKKANDPHKQKLWAQVANATLERTGSEATAIKEANSAVKRMTAEP